MSLPKDMRSKKVIFFSRDMKIGGMEKALLILLNELAKKGFEVHLVLQEKAGVLLGQLDSSVRVSEYPVCNWKPVLLRKCLNFIHRLIWSCFNFKKYDFSCNFAT